MKCKYLSTDFYSIQLRKMSFNLPKAGPYSWTSVQFSKRLFTQSTCFFASRQNSAIFIVIVTGGNGH